MPGRFVEWRRETVLHILVALCGYHHRLVHQSDGHQVGKRPPAAFTITGIPGVRPTFNTNPDSQHQQCQRFVGSTTPVRPPGVTLACASSRMHALPMSQLTAGGSWQVVMIFGIVAGGCDGTGS
jgi:hypothetical protein